MWPFQKSGSRVSVGTPEPLDINLGALDYQAFMQNDAYIKLWLPERLARAIDYLCAHNDASRPDVLRALLFEHIYGRVELEALGAWSREEEARRQHAQGRATDTGLMRSPAQRAEIEYLGKSVENFKLHLPLPLKGALSALAQRTNLGISNYVRRQLVRSLLGERELVQWQPGADAPPSSIQRAESNDAI